MTLAPGRPTGPAPAGPFPDLTATPGQIPGLPKDPLGALLNGMHLPALPGADQLMAPLHSLQSGFGSGVFGAINPTFVFKESASALDKAMSSSDAALQMVDHVWKGLAADDAKSSGKAAAGSGTRLSDQGTALGGITETAAQTVQRGNAKLAGIAQSFAHSALALAPIYFTPPGMAALMATAADHFARALATVNETQAELAVHSASITQAAAPVGIPEPPKLDPLCLADDALHVAQPLLEGVTGFSADLVQALSTPPHHDEAMPPVPPPAAPVPAVPAGQVPGPHAQAPSVPHGNPPASVEH